MLLLKEAPSGSDTFMTNLTLSSWSTATNGLTLKFETGGFLNGPHTKPCFTQLAIVSVTSAANLSVELEFLQWQEGSSKILPL